MNNRQSLEAIKKHLVDLFDALENSGNPIVLNQVIDFWMLKYIEKSETNHN